MSAGRTVMGPVRIASGSMAPTLLPGDVVLVDHRDLEPEDLRRGDLITFTGPAPGQVSLKRVVGLPGDTVAILDSVLHVNGQSVAERYVDVSEWDGMYTAEVAVPQDTVYVLGDDRLRSVDSRDFGVVAAQDLQGRVVQRVWPIWRRGADDRQLACCGTG